MAITPYLFFGGDCEEAFTTYAALMGGTIDAMLKYSDAPDGEVPDEIKNRVMHAHMTIRGTPVMASDASAEHDTPAGFAVSYEALDEADAEKVFAGLAEGGRIDQPMIETFFATKFGAVTDRFGTPWMVIASKPMG